LYSISRGNSKFFLFFFTDSVKWWMCFGFQFSSSDPHETAFHSIRFKRYSQKFNEEGLVFKNNYKENTVLMLPKNVSCPFLRVKIRKMCLRPIYIDIYVVSSRTLYKIESIPSYLPNFFFVYEIWTLGLSNTSNPKNFQTFSIVTLGVLIIFLRNAIFAKLPVCDEKLWVRFRKLTLVFQKSAFKNLPQLFLLFWNVESYRKLNALNMQNTTWNL